MKMAYELLLELMQRLSKQKVTAIKSITKKILILSTPRSGSTLFCNVLNNTECIGECAEWFNQKYIISYGRMNNTTTVDINEYLQFIMERSASSDGVFSANVHIEDVIAMHKKGVDIFKLNFDHIIYLNRKNKLAQAVSLAKSNLTGSWSKEIKGDGQALELLNHTHIVNALKQIIDSEDHCRTQLQKLINASYNYEDFVNLKDTHVYHEFFALVGLNANFSDLHSNMRKQRDEHSINSTEDFLKYLTGSES
ncbi:Stf0 family sulfotransferase [Thalassotalea sp. SU-HH00458]|uniref:Stf0 family sulfotransferase n=1 Tax=Thalassotalea sp. SU-HH00458 TaxID=3127657 RepID=UPI0031074DC4